MSDFMPIFRLLAPEHRTNPPGFPASQLASEHIALVTAFGDTLKLAIRLVIVLCRKMKAQNLKEKKKTKKHGAFIVVDHTMK